MTARSPKRGRRLLTGLALMASASGLALTIDADAQQPWRLQDDMNAPDWLTIRGETRVRYETLENQFRAAGSGSDQALSLRTLILAEGDAGALFVGAEIQDSRVYLDDSGTPLSTSIVNPIDILQAYARFDFSDPLGLERADLTLGRQTIDIGSRRVLERVEMANVIFAYTGAYWHSENERGDEWHLLYVSPVGRLPTDRKALGDDEPTGDEEEWGRRFWGVHYRRANAFGDTAPEVWVEAFLYGLKEKDTRSVPTPNRDYLQPGFRLYRAPRTARWDLEIEASYRTGSRRETASSDDVRDLDVDAWTLHAAAGYSFENAWRLRIALDYDYASGDEDPNDDRYDQYERLFGSRRTDFGHTGIYGPLTPANIEAPGFRFEIAPTSRIDARLAYKAAYLASSSDAWVVARVRDPSGESGRFIGHSMDARMRYWITPQNLRLEIGAATLLNGRFSENAPNAAGQGDPIYGFVQLLQFF